MKNGNALHLYYGDGKGKTTAAMGLALRAAGQGRRVLIAQWLKNNRSGELNALKALANVEIVLGEPIARLTSRMAEEERRREGLRQAAHYDRVAERIEDIHPQLIVLDELAVAIHKGFVDEDEAVTDCVRWLGSAEVVVTGRWAPESLLAKADYITEMVKHRHPYDLGVPARPGIEV